MQVNVHDMVKCDLVYSKTCLTETCVIHFLVLSNSDVPALLTISNVFYTV